MFHRKIRKKISGAMLVYPTVSTDYVSDVCVCDGGVGGGASIVLFVTMGTVLFCFFVLGEVLTTLWSSQSIRVMSSAIT